MRREFKRLAGFMDGQSLLIHFAGFEGNRITAYPTYAGNFGIHKGRRASGLAQLHPTLRNDLPGTLGSTHQLESNVYQRGRINVSAKVRQQK